MNPLLQETKLLNFSDSTIQALLQKHQWQILDDVKKVEAIYNFVRDEILFGYNESDTISASQVLADGYGQCNTKSTLLMALLRAVGVENRIHGFLIDKALQKGSISGISYWFAPEEILHSWVEVKLDTEWYNLEGVIIDKKYLQGLQKKFSNKQGTFCGYGVYTDNFSNPNIDWHLNHTYIQDKGIVKDLGIFNIPDQFYDEHSQKISAFKQFLYRNIARKRINQTVSQIRALADNNAL